MVVRKLAFQKIGGTSYDLAYFYEQLGMPHHSILLESTSSYSKKTSRYSFLAVFPRNKITLKSKLLSFTSLENNTCQTYHCETADDVFNQLRQFLAPKQYDPPSELMHIPFIAGYAGYVTYDFVHYIENLTFADMDNNPMNILKLYYYEKVLVLDKLNNDLWVISDEDGFIEKINCLNKSSEQSLKAKKTPDKNLNLTYTMTEEEFYHAVRTVKNYITEGDIYQANISLGISIETSKDPFELYKNLKKVNPSPFSAFFKGEEEFIVCNSPERLVQSYNNTIETRPIAGTRGRGKTHASDQVLENDLIQSAKERSEHIMLVDLERNDLGKVAQYGTVQVDELYVIEKYSHVMHLVSNIKGYLQEDMDCFDLFKAMFPGGTITGVPKIRCMEIIQELEKTRRHLYTGSIGYFDIRGTMDFNIAIRTMYITPLEKGMYHVQLQAGAGIVADSVPHYEHQECLKKAKALIQALEM